MKYRNVGKSGLKVSEIAMGSWMTDLQGSEKAAVPARYFSRPEEVQMNGDYPESIFLRILTGH